MSRGIPVSWFWPGAIRAGPLTLVHQFFLAEEVPDLNYRHQFHAGNFADVMKHALWLRLLSGLTAKERAPLLVVDTHAGAGRCDLEGPMARKSGEAVNGAVRLMADEAAPAALTPLREAILSENKGGGVRFYPGSPLLSLGALRRGDRYVACELRPDDEGELSRVLQRRSAERGVLARAVLGNGYAILTELGKDPGPRLAALIDPPYESGDEQNQILTAVSSALQCRPSTVLALWAPIKDLESLDALLRGLEQLSARKILVSEARLRPLIDPMKMNGSAMIVLGAGDMTEALGQDAREISAWVVARCGEAGGEARVRILKP